MCCNGKSPLTPHSITLTLSHNTPSKSTGKAYILHNIHTGLFAGASKKAGVKIENLSQDNILENLAPHKPKAKKEIVIEVVNGIMKKRLPDILDNYDKEKPDISNVWLDTHLKKIGNLLRNDRVLSSLLKKDI